MCQPEFVHQQITYQKNDNKSPDVIITFSISSKINAYHFAFPNYPRSEDDLVPVDLVMASAGDIGLKEYYDGKLKSNKLIFGKTRYFTYTSSYINDNLDYNHYFMKNLESMKVEWLICPCTRVNWSIAMLRLQVRVMLHAIVEG